MVHFNAILALPKDRQKRFATDHAIPKAWQGMTNVSSMQFMMSNLSRFMAANFDHTAFAPRKL